MSAPVAITARIVGVTIHLEGGASINCEPQQLPSLLGFSEEQAAPFLRALASASAAPTTGATVIQHPSAPPPAPEPKAPAPTSPSPKSPPLPSRAQEEERARLLLVIRFLQLIVSRPRGLTTDEIVRALGIPSGKNACSTIAKSLWVRLRRLEVPVERNEAIITSRGTWAPGPAASTVLDLLREHFTREHGSGSSGT